MTDASKLSVPADAHDLLLGDDPAAGIRKWMKLTDLTQRELAATLKLQPSTFSARLNGEFSWPRDDLVSVYDRLSQATQNKSLHARKVTLDELLRLSRATNRNTFLFARRARPQPQLLPSPLRVGYVPQNIFALPAVDEDGAVGIIPSVLDLIRSRFSLAEPTPPVWSEIRDVRDLFQRLANGEFDIIAPAYPALHRDLFCWTIPLPGLRLPLNGIIEAERMRAFVADQFSGRFPTDLCDKQEELFYQGENFLRFRARFFRKHAIFVVVSHELGHEYLRGLGVREDRIKQVENYNEAEVVRRFAEENDRTKTVPVALLADDFLVEKVAHILDEQRPLTRVTTLGKPYGTQYPAYPGGGKGRSFHFDLGLTSFPVSIAVGRKDQELAANLKRAIELVYEQEPVTLLDRYRQGVLDALGGTTRKHDYENRFWEVVTRHLNFEDFVRVGGQMPCQFVRNVEVVQRAKEVGNVVEPRP